VSEDKTVILRDDSGAEIEVKDFESLLSGHHLQMRMSYDTDPDSPIQRMAIQRNFAGVGHLPPVLLELFKTDELGVPVGDPIVEWMTNYPFKVCNQLTDLLRDGKTHSDLEEFVTVINPHPQR